MNNTTDATYRSFKKYGTTICGVCNTTEQKDEEFVTLRLRILSNATNLDYIQIYRCHKYTNIQMGCTYINNDINNTTGATY